MMCDQCNSRMANVVITQIVGGKQIKLYLCDKCANLNENMLNNEYISLRQFLNQLMNAKVNGPRNSISCDKCGMTLEDFKKNSKVGCAHCYEMFKDYFGSLIRRIYGNSIHTGKRPGKSIKDNQIASKINRLTQELKAAIEEEAYERAAMLRDEIKLLKEGGELKQ